MSIEFLRRQAPVMALGLVGAMFCVPFLVGWHYFPIPSFFNELVAVAIGLLACALLLRKRYWQEWKFPLIGLLPLGLVLILILQIVAGLPVFPQQNMLAALYLLWACCLIMLGAVPRREFALEKIIGVLCRFLLLAAVLSSLIGLQQLFHWHSFFDSWLTTSVSGKLVANLGQPNHLADLLALGLVSLLYLRARGGAGVVATFIFALLLLFVMGLTGSRSTWLYLVQFPLLRCGVAGARRIIVCFLLPGCFYWDMHCCSGLRASSWQTSRSPLQRLPKGFFSRSRGCLSAGFCGSTPGQLF